MCYLIKHGCGHSVEENYVVIILSHEYELERCDFFCRIFESIRHLGNRRLCYKDLLKRENDGYVRKNNTFASTRLLIITREIIFIRFSQFQTSTKINLPH
jgi:hypothetical protein